MRKLQWMTQQALNSLGWPGLTGLGLLVGVTLFYFGIFLPMQSRLTQLQLDVAMATKSDSKLAQDKRAESLSAPEAVKLFYQHFPPKESTPDWLGQIYAAAASQSLRLSQGEYKFIPGKTGKLDSYQINLPVTGSYIQIRKFIMQVLNETPVVSLDEISFKRETIGSPSVEAKIRLTLYLQES